MQQTAVPSNTRQGWRGKAAGRSSEHAWETVVAESSSHIYVAYPVAIIVILSYVSRALLVLLAGTVAIVTALKEERSERCLEVLREVCRGRRFWWWDGPRT